jgi:hypothetical protein
MRNVETTVFSDPKKYPPVRVHIQEDLCEIVFHFENFGAENVLALEINPRRTGATLRESDFKKVERIGEWIEPAVVRRVGRNYATYLEYARSILRFEDEKTRDALRNLGKAGRTKRGLSIDFISGIADDYRELVAGGEPHPVKTLAAMHQVEISTASRWISRAKQLDLIQTDDRERKQ